LALLSCIPKVPEFLHNEGEEENWNQGKRNQVQKSGLGVAKEKRHDYGKYKPKCVASHASPLEKEVRVDQPNKKGKGKEKSHQKNKEALGLLIRYKKERSKPGTTISPSPR